MKGRDWRLANKKAEVEMTCMGLCRRLRHARELVVDSWGGNAKARTCMGRRKPMQEGHARRAGEIGQHAAGSFVVGLDSLLGLVDIQLALFGWKLGQVWIKIVWAVGPILG